MKRIFNIFLTWLAIAFGYKTGVELFETLKHPWKRAAFKRKFKKIKDAIFEKEEP